jgi:hypothetical protein
LDTEPAADHELEGTVMLEHTRHKRSTSDRPVKAAPAPTERPTPRTTPAREPQIPESATERWKRQVEAEARHRLKRHVRNIAARRN